MKKMIVSLIAVLTLAGVAANFNWGHKSAGMNDGGPYRVAGMNDGGPGGFI